MKKKLIALVSLKKANTFNVINNNFFLTQVAFDYIPYNTDTFFLFLLQ